jgi:ferritin-like metal-binding protein YciE
MNFAEYEELRSEVIRHFSNYEEGIDDLQSVTAKVLEAANQMFCKAHGIDPATGAKLEGAKP